VKYVITAYNLMHILFKYNTVRKVIMTSALSSATATTATAVVVKPDRDLWLERSTTIGPVLQVTGLLPAIANLIADYTTVNDATNYAITPRVWRQLFPCLTVATFPDVPFPDTIDAVLQAPSQFELESSATAAAAPPTEQNDQARVVDREVLCYVPATDTKNCVDFLNGELNRIPGWGQLLFNMELIANLTKKHFNFCRVHWMSKVSKNQFMPPKPGRWVLLTCNTVRRTVKLSLEQQRKRLANTGYTISGPVEMLTCCLLHMAWTKTSLYNRHISTRCLQEPATAAGHERTTYTVVSDFSDPYYMIHFSQDSGETGRGGIGAMRTLLPAGEQESAAVTEVVSASTATAAAL
jgi:hypothetical protein